MLAGMPYITSVLVSPLHTCRACSNMPQRSSTHGAVFTRAGVRSRCKDKVMVVEVLFRVRHLRNYNCPKSGANGRGLSDATRKNKESTSVLCFVFIKRIKLIIFRWSCLMLVMQRRKTFVFPNISSNRPGNDPKCQQNILNRGNKSPC